MMTANVVIAKLIKLFHGRDPVPYSPEINHIVPGLISCVYCFKNNCYTHVILKCGALFPCFLIPQNQCEVLAYGQAKNRQLLPLAK